MSTVSDLATPIQQKEKLAQFMWTGFILLFFLIQAIIWMVAITITSNDKSNAVIAEYDERALNWDDELAIRHASTRLGWQAELFVDPATDILNYHAVTLKLENADKLPISNAKFELSAFHRARSGDPQQIQLQEVGNGVYSGKFQVRKSGLWQFEGQVQKNDDTFLISQQLFLKEKH